MGLLAWLRSWKIIENRNVSGRRKPSPQRRLAIETLEDRTMPSTLPGLGFSTYLDSGILGQSANAVAVDSAGNAYVTGFIDPGNGDHVFVAKFRPDGSLSYSTVLGGSSNFDIGTAIAVDSAGDAYVTGRTNSTDFPTLNALQTTYGGGTSDAFLTKLDPTGGLLYSTYLGGSGSDNGAGKQGIGAVAVDNAGNAYVAGYTLSTNFPITSNAFQTVLGNGAAFVTKVNTTLSGQASLVYSTYINGAVARGIAVDSSGDAYLTGSASPALPTTPGAFMVAPGSVGHGFVAKLNANGSALVYATFLPDSGDYGIAVNGAGNAFVTGQCGNTLATTPGAYQTTSAWGQNAFMTELNVAGSGLVYSSYFGGAAQTIGYAVALDSIGHAFVTGSSYKVPVKNAFQPIAGGAEDAFVAEFDLSQSGDASLVYSTYLGGKGDDYGHGIAVDGLDNVLVVGQTDSTDFPLVNAYQSSYQWSTGAFVTKVLPPPANVTSVTLASSLSPAVVGQNVTFTATVTAAVAGTGTPDGTVVFLDGSTTLGTASLDVSGYATFTTSALTAGAHSIKAVYLETTVFQESSSPILTQNEAGSQASSSTLTSSANPSVYGQAVTLTATVKATSGTGTPGGYVTFMDGATVVGTGTMTNGVATLSTSALVVGNHNITAVYAGDNTFAASNSPALSQTVKQAATKTTVVASLKSALFGQPVTFTVTVAPVTPGAGTPTGTITIMDGTTVLGTATVVNGKATFTTSILPKGKHTITAIYNGDVDFLTSTSASLTETTN